MKDLEKRLSIIEEKLGINKVNLHVGLKFTTGKDGIIYEITSLSNNFLKVGWKGIEDRVDYSVSKVNTLFNNGDWKVYEPTDKFADLKEAERNGYVIECRIKKTPYVWVEKTHKDFFDSFDYRIKTQQPTLEQGIQQLKDKYKQYRFTITIEDNI